MLKLGRYSVAVTVLNGGAGTLSIRIPGTFTTIDKTASNYAALELRKVTMFFGNPAYGDHVKRITMQDTDGVIPVPARSLFPNYPIISDSASIFSDDSNKGGYIHPSMPLIFEPQGGSALIPSGLYLILDVQKVSALADSFYTTLLLDDRS